MTTELPTLEDAEHLVDNGYAEPLDEFVARWQPKHHIDKRIWRKDLQKVLDGYDQAHRLPPTATVERKGNIEIEEKD
jgi:hypothetical protein